MASTFLKVLLLIQTAVAAVDIAGGDFASKSSYDSADVLLYHGDRHLEETQGKNHSLILEEDTPMLLGDELPAAPMLLEDEFSAMPSLTAPPLPMISLLETTEKTVTVKVRQSFIGDPDNCKLSQKASFLFMVYKHWRFFDERCTLERHVDACYEKTIVLPCDPLTSKATIDVYVALDRSGTLKGKDAIENPFVGRCFPQDRESIPRSIKYSETYECFKPGSQADQINLRGASPIDDVMPTSCSAVLKNDPSSKDGEYIIWHEDITGEGNHKPMRLHCHNMKGPGIPLEYITVQDLHNSYSTSIYRPRGYRYPPIFRTNFFKIRLDPVTLKVDIADYTFTFTGDVYIPYGYCSVCNSDFYRSHSRVDLRTTDFKVADTSDYKTKGGTGSVKASYNNQLVDYTIVGTCASISPGPDVLHADLPPGSFFLQLALADRKSVV